MLFRVPSQWLRICLLSFVALFIATTVVANPLPVQLHRRVGTQSKQKETAVELWFGRVDPKGEWIQSTKKYQPGEVAVLGLGNWLVFSMSTVAKKKANVDSRKIVTFNPPNSNILTTGKKYVQYLDGKVDFGVDDGLHVEAYQNALRTGLEKIEYIENETNIHLVQDTTYISAALQVIDKFGLFEEGVYETVSKKWDMILGAYEIMRTAHNVRSV